ncbi:hypothetical protein N8H74_22370 [Pseudomonas sp. B2M1-30]|uniref:nSTAND3 domain-containing NTPase n=1 Tax=Pseudomonas TaxID=286 RepID=UPI0021C6315C|nr:MULTISPECIES: hypothetical protein [Pseudomonas]MCU0121018.1 hypothetical protein [Pseudomonas sp. B2M1-30]MCU7262647.1 hypothetical protein [Pseudomonas koreensis]
MVTPHNSKAQSTAVSYQLHSLGWKAFQQLCSTILGDIWGQTFQIFSDTNDGGRDGAFSGSWQNKSGENYSGSFAVQCKFTSNSATILKISNLTDELDKAQRLAAKNLANNYFIFSNAKLTGNNEEKIKEAFEAITGINNFVIYGEEKITALIHENPRLRMLVPRVYGLGDLSQILDERAYAQGVEILSSLGDDLKKFVITDAYQRSARALVSHGFVLLLGEPACGKSTIAAALALGAADEWRCSTIKITDADSFIQHSNPHEKDQFFWVDDAFGATQLDIQKTIAWNNTFPHIQAAINRGSKIIFTSRSYIFHAAKNLLKQSALPVFKESQVVINVEQISTSEREQILYNHIKLGSQTLEFKKTIKPYLKEVAKLKSFTPEIARRLGGKEFTKKLVISPSGLADFVDRPMEFLKEVIETLDINSRAAIALIFMRGGAIASPVNLDEKEARAIFRMGGNEGLLRSSLTALDGSLIANINQDGNYEWRFKHPTIRDVFASMVAEDRELMDIYIAGTPLPQIFREVSCGNMEIQGVKVIIPKSRYTDLINRMQKLINDHTNRDSLNRFLAHRCDADFLNDFFSKNPQHLEGLNIRSYMSAVSDVSLITRLHTCKILPETLRIKHIEKIKKLAISIPDSDFLSKNIIKIFEKNELDDILKEVKIALLPNLEETINDWHSDHNESEDPASHFNTLTSALRDYQKALEDDEEAYELIEKAFDLIDESIYELRKNHYGEQELDYEYRDHYKLPTSDSRSIFDDIDQ